MEGKISQIIELSEVLADLPPGSYHNPCRKMQYQLCRNAANNIIMREIGIDYNVLSKYIKSKNRATLYTQYKKHEQNMKYWSNYKIFYKLLKSKFLNNPKDGEYIDSTKFIKILKDNKINPAPKLCNNILRLCITVQIGHFEGKVYTNTKKLSNALKKLFIAFYEYEYKFNITKVKRNERIYKTT